jgi:carbon monoxide dehydrogenase subunit G
MKKLAAILMLLSLFQAQAFADSGDDKDIEVKVRIDGEDVVVDVSFPVPATPQEVWAVMTDFDHMASFVSNVQTSRVIDRTGNILHIAQQGKAQHGPLSFEFDSVREIRLHPFDRIQSHLTSGKMRKLEGDTQLRVEGDATRVAYHGDSIPGVWIPPIIGKMFIENELREQFRDIRNEIGRRKLAARVATLPRRFVGGLPKAARPPAA